MRVYHAPETADHAPEFFMLRGRVVANEERAERAQKLLEAMDKLALVAEAPPPAPLSAITAVHMPRYVDFLETVYAAWRAQADAGPEVLANVAPRAGEARYPEGVVGRAGWHLSDLACPVGAHTARAARRSADTAVAAAEALGEEVKTSYALCRPPGHHAGSELAAGHCFYNNAAIAAETLRRAGARTAILDIDVHHGNGTQSIFYADAEMLTVSIHTDPREFYPWFVGHGDEVGRSAGEGMNRNIPLPKGTGDLAWLEAVTEGFETVKANGVDALVLALGLDVHESDPLAGMAVTREGIARAGALIGTLSKPIIVTQEGGYLSPSLTDNAAAFFGAFLEARPL